MVVEEARPIEEKRGAVLEKMRAAKPQVRGARGGPAYTSSEEAECAIESLPRKRRADCQVMRELGIQKWSGSRMGESKGRLSWRR